MSAYVYTYTCVYFIYVHKTNQINISKAIDSAKIKPEILMRWINIRGHWKGNWLLHRFSFFKPFHDASKTNALGLFLLHGYC